MTQEEAFRLYMPARGRFPAGAGFEGCVWYVDGVKWCRANATHRLEVSAGGVVVVDLADGHQTGC